MWTAIPATSLADALALAGVDAGADRDAGAARALGDAERAADRPRRPVEGGEEAVAHRLDLVAAVGGELGADERVVGVEQLAPRAVADLGRALGRADDVGEQDGRQHPLGRAGGARAGDELLELVHERVGVVEEDDALAARQLDEAGAGHVVTDELGVAAVDPVRRPRGG